MKLISFLRDQTVLCDIFRPFRFNNHSQTKKQRKSKPCRWIPLNLSNAEACDQELSDCFVEWKLKHLTIVFVTTAVLFGVFFLVWTWNCYTFKSWYSIYTSNLDNSTFLILSVWTVFCCSDSMHKLTKILHTLFCWVKVEAFNYCVIAYIS